MRGMEARMSGDVSGRWGRWTIFGGRIEPLTEERGAAGNARWPVWREGMGNVWVVHV